METQDPRVDAVGSQPNSNVVIRFLGTFTIYFE
jgi:hypothetical protein